MKSVFTVTNNTKESEDERFQQLMGGIGRYHALLILFMLPCRIPAAMHPLGIVFLAPPVRYTCEDVGANRSVANLCPCENPLYDRETFRETVITEWDLICDRGWMVSFAQTILMLGMLVGSFVFGTVSDKFGRKPALLAGVALEISVGALASLSPNYWLFAAFRFLSGFSIGGIFIVSFVLVMEFTGKRHRETVSCLLQLPFNAGYALMPLIGYFIRSWTWINLAYSLPAVGLIAIYWVLPESPRWLLTHGRTLEAKAIVEKVAKVNNRPTDDVKSAIAEYELRRQATATSSNLPSRGKTTDLVRVPSIRKHLACAAVNWAVCSFGFYGLSQYVGRLGGDVFANVSISAGLNCVGTGVAWAFMRLLPRRAAMVALNVGTSACLLSIALLPESGAFAKVLLACVGGLCSFAAFVAAYLYTAELFPTAVRSAAMGASSMFSRVGAMMAPFVIPLGDGGTAWLPPLIFGVAPLLAALSCLFLPETKNRKLFDTIGEVR